MASAFGAYKNFWEGALFSKMPDVGSLADMDYGTMDAYYGGDQEWLAKNIWPSLGADMLVYDSYSCEVKKCIGNGTWHPMPVPRRGPLDFIGLQLHDTIVRRSDSFVDDDLFGEFNLTGLFGEVAVKGQTRERWLKGFYDTPGVCPERCRLQKSWIFC